MFEGVVFDPMDYQELILVFMLGLISGFFVEYVHHYFSVKRSKKEGFLPYMRKLYGSVSEIMEKTDAEELNRRYDRFINAKIKEKMRESAIKELAGKESIKFHELMSPAYPALLMFLSSYNSLIEVIRECKRFESTYVEMEKKGLIDTLKIHHGRLYSPLSFFHSSANYIAEETAEIVDNLVTAYELKEGQASETIFEDNVFEIIRKIATHNLFHFGSELQKQLRKRV